MQGGVGKRMSDIGAYEGLGARFRIDFGDLSHRLDERNVEVAKNLVRGTAPEFALVLEMVGDERVVNPRTIRYVPRGRTFEAVFRKRLGGSIQKFLLSPYAALLLFASRIGSESCRLDAHLFPRQLF